MQIQTRIPVLGILCWVSGVAWAGGPPGAGLPPDQIRNGGFEKGLQDWTVWGGSLADTGFAGKNSLQVSNNEAKWSGADQVLQLPIGVAEVLVSGWGRTSKVVVGRMPWEKARIALEFQDDGGALVGGYPAVTLELQGNTSWTEGRKTYQVPDGATQLKLQCALGNATGTAWFDNISVEFRGVDGRAMNISKPPPGPIDWGQWYDLPAAEPNQGFVDWSGLLDAPAGKHGFVKATSAGELAFEDGTPVRFWGINLMADQVFSSDESNKNLAERLAKQGCNIVRLHHMDAPWSRPNLFGNSLSTRKIDSTQMDRLDQLLFSFKQKGIYVFLDLLVHREMGPADGLPQTAPLGAKQVGIYDSRLIDLQKDYARQILEHVNPYTGKSWKDEAAVAFSEYINESTIFTNFEGSPAPGEWKRVLDSLWHKSGGKGAVPVFGLDWSKSGGFLTALDKDADNPRGLRFLDSLEGLYTAAMRGSLRKSGAKYPLAFTNFPPKILLTLRRNAQEDVVLTNDYWDHPQVWKLNNDWSRVDYAPMDNGSQLAAPGKAIAASRAWAQVEGKPLVVTEWDHVWPNEYELEGPMLMATMAGMQGWDGAIQFRGEREALGSARLAGLRSNLNPVVLAEWVVAVPAFLRHDIPLHPSAVVEAIDSAALWALPGELGLLERQWQLPWVARVSKTFDGKSTGDTLQGAENRKGVLEGAGGAVAMDVKSKVLRIRASRIEGAMGFLSKKAEEFSRLSFQVENPHAAFWLVSRDTVPLASSKHVLLVAHGATRNKGETWSYSRKSLEDPGTTPVQVQRLQGKIRLKPASGAKTLEIRPLAGSGVAGEPLLLKKEGDWFEVDLSQAQTLVFSVESK